MYVKILGIKIIPNMTHLAQLQLLTLLICPYKASSSGSNCILLAN